MIDFIQDSIDNKPLSRNTRDTYFYNLQQFVEAIDSKVSGEKLALYEHSLPPLKASARERKISAVNQFLYFSYETDQPSHFYKLSNREKITTKPIELTLLDYRSFYQETNCQTGQLIALLTIEFGLSSSDIQQLKVADFDLTFAILRMQRTDLVRVLELPEKLLPYMIASSSENQFCLFDNQGKAYSRQQFFDQLKSFLATLDLDYLPAQAIRQQYVLYQKAAGRSILEVSRNLSLKSPVTLGRFYK